MKKNGKKWKKNEKMKIKFSKQKKILQCTMSSLHWCMGHTAWAPEGREGRSQAGPKGPKPAPRLLVYKYFSWFFSSCKLFDAVLRLVFNSSPKFISHPACRLLELQLTFCKFSCCSRLCSTRTQILFKSETGQLAIWNIWTARKWVLWWKSIISHFTLHWDCSIVLVFPVKTFLGGDENFSFKFPFWPFLLYHQHCLIWNTRS